MANFFSYILFRALFRSELRVDRVHVPGSLTFNTTAVLTDQGPSLSSECDGNLDPLSI